MHLPTVPARESRLVAWTRNSASLVIVACLLAMAAANISLRASWDEVEDGVLWAGQPEGVVAAEIALESAAAHAGLRAGDILVAIDGHAVETPNQALEILHASRRGDQLTYTMLRTGERQLLQLKLEPSPQGNRGALFRAGGRRHLHAAGRLLGPDQAPLRPRDPALLLAVRRFLRRVRVLLQRAPRPARLGLLLVGRRGDAGAAAAVPALRPGVPGTAQRLGAVAGSADPCCRWRTRRPSRSGSRAALLVARALGEDTFVSSALGLIDRLEMLYFAAGLMAGFAVMVACASAARTR